MFSFSFIIRRNPLTKLLLLRSQRQSFMEHCMHCGGMFSCTLPSGSRMDFPELLRNALRMRPTFSSDAVSLEFLTAVDNKLPVSMSCLSYFIIDTVIGTVVSGLRLYWRRNRRCTRIADLCSANDNTQKTFFCGVHMLTDERYNKNILLWNDLRMRAMRDSFNVNVNVNWLKLSALLFKILPTLTHLDALFWNCNIIVLFNL